LDLHATEFFCDWDKVANDTVALLRAEAGRDPYDRHLSDLIGELSTRSEEFRVRWAAHHVRIHTTGTKRFHDPVVGDLEPATRPRQRRTTRALSPLSRVVGIPPLPFPSSRAARRTPRDCGAA
jgi:hypothetical protein